MDELTRLYSEFVCRDAKNRPLCESTCQISGEFALELLKASEREDNKTKRNQLIGAAISVAIAGAVLARKWANR